ncbi:chemotaxis protein methyltransferase [soil metagenome]
MVIAAVGDASLTRGDFERVRKLIYARAGIALSEAKQQMAHSRLSRRVRATGAAGFGDYLDRLERHGGDEWQEFVNALTTNLTSFFREQHHFPLLAEFAGRHASSSAAPLKVWCSAASTGEEPYSIAMTLAELGQTQASVLSTDIDTKVLETARRGVYRDDGIKTLESAQLRRWFLKGRGANAGHVKVRPELQRMCRFEPLNLLADSWSIGGPFDAIFCRNVMIYFDKPTQYRVLERFAAVLRPGGLLFAGHSENFSEARQHFTLRGKTVYERT